MTEEQQRIITDWLKRTQEQEDEKTKAKKDTSGVEVRAEPSEPSSELLLGG